MSAKLRVGIIGLHAGQSWAAKAHVPALRALADRFEIAGVANASRTSSEAAASAAGLARGFGSVAELVGSPFVDVVTVTVKVPHHFELVTAALEAGKHVYCEWPLGNGLREAEELAALAKKKGVVAVAGTQARLAPEVRFVASLIREGFVGDVLSSTMTAWGGSWGPTIDAESNRYLLAHSNGATLLSIPVGHTLAAVRDVLGDVASVSAVVANRRAEVRALDTGNLLQKTSPDQILVSATLASGAPFALHYRGGMPRGGSGRVWEINGSRGDLRITGPFGHTQLVPLAVEGATGDEKAMRGLDIPASFHGGVAALNPMVGNVARVYERMGTDIDEGSRTAPDFADAVALHRLLDTIETSASQGQRLALGS